MSRTNTARDDRIELRATKEEKRLLAVAAAYERLDVTGFIMRSALPAARDVVDRAERIVLSARDSKRVLELLENPAEADTRPESCGTASRGSNEIAPVLDWREEPIGRQHDRTSFDCGAAELNEYLHRYARQDHESGGAKAFVAVSPAAPSRVLGYYSISPGGIAFARVPARLTKRLGRYDVPVFRLGRLAVDRSVQGRRLGGELLLVAGERALAVAAEVGGVALAIDAKDERAANWYARFGALTLLDDPLKLILPLAVVAEVLAAAEKRGRVA